MKLEVEVISKEIIKPSSPTPNNLHHYQLSFLDQISPSVYIPIVLFYPTNTINLQFNNNVEKSNQLKKSLSFALTNFYPLAGRIKNESFVDCNDEGIPYVTARVNCNLLSVIQNLIPCELNKLFLFVLDDTEELPLGIQFNVFDCGGIAIGVGISHKVADALSMLMFVKNWADINAQRDYQGEIPSVEFLSAKLFPPKNLSGFKPIAGITKENIAAKRFVFSASKIESIREKYTNYNINITNQQIRRPSRIEALSSFIWSRFAAATKLQSKPDRFYTIVHTVNLRTRIEPHLPNHCFGNLSGIAVTVNPPINFINGDDHQESCQNLVSQVRDSISKIDKEYVKRLQEGKDHLDFIKERAESFIKGEMVSFRFTSFCRFPLYEADFGWGKPACVGPPPILTFKNLVVFMDTVSGDGIEAWINLKEEDMAKFENDNELLAFVN